MRAIVLACGAIALLGIGLGSCVFEDPQWLESEQPLIYGSDNRQEGYQASAALQGVADSVVVMLRSYQLTQLADGRWRISTPSTYGQSWQLCSTEPYRDQPDPGICSGALVGSDLIVTAGHCVSSSSCPTARFVFGFRMLDGTTVRSTVDANDVYACSQVVARQQTTTNDFAVVRVDRPVQGHTPLSVRSTGAVALNDPLVLLGHPMGIPLKVAGGATVRWNGHPDYFEGNLDAYAGNSGSPVIHAGTLEVEGILVRGNPDLVRVGRGKNRCYTSNVCPDTGCPGWEEVTRATNFAAYLGTPN